MRLFFAADIDPGTNARVNETIARLKAIDPSVKWVRPENHHITVYFFGETDDAAKESIERVVVEATAGIGAFPVRIGGISAFPSVERPRVLWIGVDNPGGELTKVYETVRASVRREKLPVNEEERGLTPHLTIGRVRDRCSPALIREVKRSAEAVFGEFRVGAAVLYRSVLGRDGPVYTPIKTITLA